jgi:hypothetical protein
VWLRGDIEISLSEHLQALAKMMSMPKMGKLGKKMF